MATRLGARKRKKDAGQALLTEVVIKGEVAGAVVWTEDRTASASVFVEKKDFRYFGDNFIRLYSAGRERKGRG
jgi:hypothetical protein